MVIWGHDIHCEEVYSVHVNNVLRSYSSKTTVRIILIFKKVNGNSCMEELIHTAIIFLFMDMKLKCVIGGPFGFTEDCLLGVSVVIKFPYIHIYTTFVCGFIL